MAHTLFSQRRKIAMHSARDVLIAGAHEESFALERPGVAWDWMRQTGQAPTGADWVRPQVSDAWARCIEDHHLPIGADFSPRVASSPLQSTSVDPASINPRDAFAASLPLMVYNLRPFLDEGNVTLLLSDETGKVVHLIDAALGICAAGQNLARIGGDWCEASIGNNGVGTSCVLREAVAFEGKEHFAKALHPFATAGCPVIRPDGETAAVIGMITDRRESAKLMLGFLRITCQIMETSLFEHFASEGFVLRLRHGKCAGDMDGQENLIDGKILVSAEGRVEGLNRSSLEMLALTDHASALGKSLSSVIGADLSSLTSVHNECTPVEHVLERTNRKILVEAFRLGESARPSTVTRYDASRYRCSASSPDHGAVSPTNVWQDVVLDAALQKACSLQERNISLLITGESGVGKDFLVRQLHAKGLRYDKPLVAINCAAIPRDLIESELFGYEGGSFTGARAKGKSGKFLEADKGILFLDEIGDMALDLQATLLRVLDCSEVTPVGASRPVRVDVRVIAATNRRLRDMVAEGSFRRDLYYRLNGVQISLPPLRERPDRLRLIEQLLNVEQQGLNGERKTLSDDVWGIFFQHPWPGNIREARNVLRSSIAVSRTRVIDVEDLPPDFLEEVETGAPAVRRQVRNADAAVANSENAAALADWEEQAVRSALAMSAGNVTKAARSLGITRATLYHKMDRYQLRVERRAAGGG